MFRRKKAPLNLSEGEEIVACISQHWIALIPSTFLLLIIALIILILTFLLLELYLLDMPETGRIVFFVILGFLLIWLAIEYHKIHQECLFITTQRLANIEIKSLFYKRTIEVHYDKIETVYTSVKGFFRTIFNVGDITIKTGAQEGDIQICSLPRPVKIQSLILELQQKYVRSPIAMENKREEETSVNRETLTSLLNYLKLEDKKDHFLKPKHSKGELWKEVIKEYLGEKQQSTISKEQTYLKKKRDQEYDSFLSSLGDSNPEDKRRADSKDGRVIEKQPSPFKIRDVDG